MAAQPKAAQLLPHLLWFEARLQCHLKDSSFMLLIKINLLWQLLSILLIRGTDNIIARTGNSCMWAPYCRHV